MTNTYRLTFTQALHDALVEGWRAETDWIPSEIERDVAKIGTVPIGTVITFTDDEPRPEDDPDFDGSQYTPEQLIVVGWEYYGFPPAVAPYERVR